MGRKEESLWNAPRSFPITKTYPLGKKHFSRASSKLRKSITLTLAYTLLLHFLSHFKGKVFLKAILNYQKNIYEGQKSRPTGLVKG